MKETIEEVIRCEVPSLAQFRKDVSPLLETALGQALSPDRNCRYDTAEAFAGAIEAATNLASTRTVADWVKQLVGAMLAERDEAIVHIEKTRTTMAVPVGGAREEAPEARREGALSDMLTPEWVPSPSGVADAAPEPTLDDVEAGYPTNAATLRSTNEEPRNEQPSAPAMVVRPRWSTTQLVGLVVTGVGLVVSLVAGAVLVGSGGAKQAARSWGVPVVKSASERAAVGVSTADGGLKDAAPAPTPPTTTTSTRQPPPPPPPKPKPEPKPPGDYLPPKR
jgi:hypothetical protein